MMNSIKSKLNTLNRKQKKVIVFSIICVLTLVFLVLAITFMIVGIDDYKTFVDAWKTQNTNNPTNIPNITMFVYGCFCLMMTIIFLITIALYGNHTFNKKYQNKN